MKRIAYIIAGVAGLSLFLLGIGHSMAIDIQQTPHQSPVSLTEKQKAAIEQQHALTEAKLNTSLQASVAQNTELTAKWQAACARLQKASIVVPECK